MKSYKTRNELRKEQYSLRDGDRIRLYGFCMVYHTHLAHHQRETTRTIRDEINLERRVENERTRTD